MSKPKYTEHALLQWYMTLAPKFLFFIGLAYPYDDKPRPLFHTQLLHGIKLVGSAKEIMVYVL